MIISIFQHSYYEEFRIVYICVYDILCLRFKEMKDMDISIEDDDCAVEAVTLVKKKKMKQGFLYYIINTETKVYSTS